VILNWYYRGKKVYNYFLFHKSLKKQM